jgi:hypothetical protein
MRARSRGDTGSRKGRDAVAAPVLTLHLLSGRASVSAPYVCELPSQTTYPALEGAAEQSGHERREILLNERLELLELERLRRASLALRGHL